MKYWKTLVTACAVALGTGSAAFAAEPLTSADVVVYEGTPGGVMAAVAAGRHGKSVILVEMKSHVGGVVSGGLCDSDIGDRDTVGGLSKEFFDRVLKYYKDTYGEKSKQVEMSRQAIKFEPHVAELIYETMLKEAHVTVWKSNRLKSVTMNGKDVGTLVAEDLANGGTHTFTGKIFIDGSYEGDLIAAAKVPYRFGREGRSEYNEYLAGVGAGPDKGKADNLIMSYNYRVSITPNTANAVPFTKPEHYDPEPWSTTYGERIKKGNLDHVIQLFASGPGRAGPNDKLDTNWFDFPGSSNGYTEGDWATRDACTAKIRDYAQSLLYYLQNGPDLPAAFKEDAAKWGYPKDEFLDTGHFPFQVYVREARRMVGQVLLTENDITHNRYKADGVCEGSYGVDCHIIQILDVNGKRTPDHTPHVLIAGYDIPYGCLTPTDTPDMPRNLLVPVACSTTHVVYCSLRMEPVFMMLGHAAGDAAAMALDHRISTQKVDVKELRTELRKEGAVLDNDYLPQAKIAFTPAHPKVGEKVQFTMERGEIRDPLTKIAWDFEGNGKVGAADEKAEHEFKTEKTYNVSLVVIDKAGRHNMFTAEVPVGSATAKDVTIDDFDGDFTGRWDGHFPETIVPPHQRIPDVWIGPGSHTDMVHQGKRADATAKFEAEIPRAGKYEVCLAYRPMRQLATNTPITIHSAEGDAKLTVDQKKDTGSPFPFYSLGTFNFKAGKAATVSITNEDTDGRVEIDGIRWVWVGE